MDLCVHFAWTPVLSPEYCFLLCVAAASSLALQHEKIIRGVAVGLALVQYGREEGAEVLIEQMTRELVGSGRWGCGGGAGAGAGGWVAGTGGAGAGGLRAVR